jgi:hypothetical protein
MNYIHSIIFATLITLTLTHGCNNNQSQPLESLFPESIKESRLVRLITGKQALNKINKLHGKKIGITEGCIGMYKANNRPTATVYFPQQNGGSCTKTD